MSGIEAKRRIFAWLRVALLLLGVASVVDAHAVPSFRRQTGLECTACHLSWPELTAVGRNFKLNGYTLGDARALPLAAMVVTSVSKQKDLPTDPPDNTARNGELLLQEASLFLAGRISEHFGLFSQYTYSGIEHHGALDNTDIRYANSVGSGADKIVFGATLHNNPTLQDVWNSTPAFRFPYMSSEVSIGPNAATQIEGALSQQVAGLGAYVWWHKTVYAELTAYRNATHGLGLLSQGTDTSLPALDGYNPYWRLAVSQDWDEGRQSAMVGTYGAVFKKFAYDGSGNLLNPSTPSDRLRDVAVDAQYQYVTDEHRYALQASLITEKQDWRASNPFAATSNANDTLKSFSLRGTYYYDRQYGINLSYFSIRGDHDDVLYNSGEPLNGSVNGSPNSSGWIAELDWLPKRDIRVALQYTWYQKFNGARTNYDGNGRDASTNNTLFLFGWFMF
jgi:hypothetical protein